MLAAPAAPLGPAPPPRTSQRRSRPLGRLVSRPEHLELFGLARPGDGPDGRVDLPCVESVRSSRRVGPDGQVVFDLVAEATQRREVADPGGAFDFYGGATVILDAVGRVRLVVSERVLNRERAERQREYLEGRGSSYWTRRGGRREALPSPFGIVHRGNGDAPAAAAPRAAVTPASPSGAAAPPS